MRTNAGADWQAGVMADTANTGNTPGQYAPANYIALTDDTGTPVDTDTTLPGEIETGALTLLALRPCFCSLMARRRAFLFWLPGRLRDLGVALPLTGVVAGIALLAGVDAEITHHDPLRAALMA